MSDPVRTNLKILQPSRRRLRPGDLFVLQPDDRFCYGRVIRTDAFAGPSMSDANLIYLYRPRAETSTAPERSALSPHDLLVPPAMINRLPWSRGYFQTIAHWPLEEDEVLEQHCFRDGRGRHLDEFRTVLPGPVEPVGTYGLHSFRSIDDLVSRALGLPPA